MAGLFELKKDDLQNINFPKIREKVLQHPTIFINIILLAVTIFVVHYIYSIKKAEVVGLANQVTNLDKKLFEINEFIKGQKDFNEFIDQLPQGVPAANIIAKLTNFAVARNVRILSYSPATEADMPLYKIIRINLDVTSTSYKDMLLFLYDIENSVEPLRVEEWRGEMKEDEGPSFRSRKIPQPEAQGPDPDTISAKVKISAINFKKL